MDGVSSSCVESLIRTAKSKPRSITLPNQINILNQLSSKKWDIPFFATSDSPWAKVGGRILMFSFLDFWDAIECMYSVMRSPI